MERLKKNTGVIAFSRYGGVYEGVPFVQTDYDYELIVDPLLNEPVFLLRSETQIIFPGENGISFRSYVLYVMESSSGGYIHADELWELTLEGRATMNNILDIKITKETCLSGITLPVLVYEEEKPVLQKLALAGFRLN